MRAWMDDQARAAAALPPIRLEIPLDPHRATNDALALRMAGGGPEMARSEDRWVFARGRRILCRLHIPRNAPDPAPALVYFHGGGWVWASIDTHDRLAREYAEGAGIAVVNVDYALSPEAKFPQAVEECAAVADWLGRHGAEWGIDPARLVLGGDSAGGNLALGAALLLRDAGGTALRGVLASYPVCDSRLDTASYRDYGAGLGLTTEKMAFYWSVYVPHAADRTHHLAAPLRADLAGLPPVRLQIAENDVLRAECEALDRKLRASLVPTETSLYTGTVHGFVRCTDTVAKAKAALADSCAWLRRVAAAGW
ncbi:MAG: alpha/beta hydrolase [Rhodospirillales bacterium]|nr:alpha/beta hydrolase [Rhodospirillales bacterium]